MITISRFVSMAEELERYYDTFDTQEAYFAVRQEELYKNMECEDCNGQKASVLQHKVAQMRLLAEESDIQVFRHFPFWFQMSAARVRTSWGGMRGPYGGLFLYTKRAAGLVQEYLDTLQKDREEGFFHGRYPVSHDNHMINMDTILELGLRGLKEKALYYKEFYLQKGDESKDAFYDAAVESLDVLAALSVRFAEEAERLLEAEQDEDVKANLRRIAKTAIKIPLKPAESFYEALAAIVFCKECIGTLDGVGVSSFGHLDRILLPYYERDLAAGRITREEAKDLLTALFVNHAIRFMENTDPRESGTSVILGGCDAEGNVVYNAVTEMILDLEEECRFTATKMDCRVSGKHPEQYLRRLARLQSQGLNCIVMLNDDVYIPARVRQGQDVKDVRLYGACGCHELVLAGSEVCTRADSFINLPRIFLKTLQKKDYDDFEALYRETMRDIQAYHESIVAAKNKVEKQWCQCNPMPLYSAVLKGCLEKGIDVSAGGSQYATTTLSMVAPATLVDSLYAVKTLCFEEKKVSLVELCDILASDFSGNETLRLYIINRIPKYGSGDTEVDNFTVRVMKDLSHMAGQINGRGGKYMPGIYPHETYRFLGKLTGATPDGRKAGYALSRGCSPSEFLSGITPLDMLKTVEKIDFTKFAESMALEVTLPDMAEPKGEEVVFQLIREFLARKGATLQINVLDHALLLEAKEHPEQHRDIIVRVCGFSQYFVLLDAERQADVIGRAVRG